MAKIAVIVNKNWEAEAVVAALVNVGLRPTALPFPVVNYIPPYDKKSTDPRLKFFFDNGDLSTEVTLWCIQDMMFWDIPSDPPRQSGSSSAEKYRVLPPILNAYGPDLVISVSTAGYPADFSCNGSVVIGGNFFMHDGHPSNPLSLFEKLPEDVGRLMVNNVNEKVFSLISNEFKNKVEPKFLKTPRNPCEHPSCIASKVFSAVSVINVTDYAEYNWADYECMAHYKAAVKEAAASDPNIKDFPAASSETTHGIVKLCTNKPIIFMSPITDQFGHFDFEVTPTQNFAASFNAGLALGQLLCDLADFVKCGNTFAKVAK